MNQSNENQNNERTGRRSDRSRRSALPFRVFDIVIIAVIVIISLCPLLFILGKSTDTVVVTWHGNEIYRGPISTDAEISTPDGSNTIVVKDGSVYMSEANCADRICVDSGRASASRPIICLPNRVVVSIVSSEEVDGVSW